MMKRLMINSIQCIIKPNKHNFSKQYIQYRHLSIPSQPPPSSSSSDNSTPRPIGIIEEDVLYQQNSTDIFITIKTIVQGFLNFPSAKDLNKLYEVSGEFTPMIWLSLSTNLLLKKYDFDAYDFHIGSKYAIKQLQLSIASKDFYNYINKYTNDNTVNEYMKLNLHSILFKGCVDAISHLNNNKQMIIMKECDITNVKISSINTYIVTNTIDEDDVAIINDIEIPKRINYPIGSVICVVDVSFVANSTYEYHLENEIKEEAKAGKSVWTFQSCISNHAPLAWIVTKFDGLGA